MSRSMTAAEKANYRAAFPNLDVDAAVVTDEATPDLPPPARIPYNCLAWTLGITNDFIWPGANESDFDRLYAQHGFARASSGPIAAWGYSATAMTHGSISGPGHGPRWESKLGHGLRIQHGKDELRSPPLQLDGYGSIRYYYKPRAFMALRRLGRWVRHMVKKPSPTLSASQIAEIQSAAAAVAPDIQTQFERLYEVWRLDWQSPQVVFSSNPAIVRSLPQFDALVALGPEALPLVAAKLVDPSQFLALQLFEALAERLSTRMVFDDDGKLSGERARALRALQRWTSTL